LEGDHRSPSTGLKQKENVMSELSPRDRELVALGAAMGSNCASCIEYHIPKSREVGLADREILAAIKHADLIRQVPARKTLQTALGLLGDAESLNDSAGCGCEAIVGDAAAETSSEGCGCS
jgi:4-carboxymuconolactone decarboxylase